MASFDVVLPIILGFEGGYVDNPTDPGGETNKGITMATFRSCSQKLLGIDPTSDNLKALTNEQAGTIYHQNYWVPMQGDSIALQDLANIVCDFNVNSGSHAIVLLQQVMKDLGASVVVDGCLGPATMQALSGLDPTEVYRQYKAGRIAYYQQLGQKYPQFLAGWLKRANAFPDL